MRRTKAKRLWKAARELMKQRGIEGSGYAVVQLPRKENRMRLLERQRREASERLLLEGRPAWNEIRRLEAEKDPEGEIAQQALTREIAEILVPPPAPHGETLVCTGVRAAYRQLKRAYLAGEVRGI